MNAIGAGIGEFWNVFGDNTQQRTAKGFDARIGLISYLTSWYDGTVFVPRSPFRDVLVEQLYLYDETRLTWNPVPDIVDFWAHIIYPGDIADDMGPESAIPIELPPSIEAGPLLGPKGASRANGSGAGGSMSGGAGGGDEEGSAGKRLKDAAFTALQWGNWNVNKNVVERMTGITGNGFIRINDDVERGKVYPEIIMPYMVRDVQLNIAGDVTAYSLEYKMYLDDAPTEELRRVEHIYREDVDRDYYSTFLDGKPYDFSPGKLRGAVWPNPYGFVPAIYRYHRRTLTERGIPAVGASLGELCQINSLESHLDDQVHKAIDPQTIFWGSAGLKRMLARDSQEAAATGKDIAPKKRDLFRFWETNTVGRAEQVTGAASIAEASAHIENKKVHFKEKFPELTVYENLRTMSNISGRAAEILLGETKPKVVERRGEADPQTRKMIQMCIAIAGFRQSEAQPGTPWARDMQTAAQKKFAGFSLESFDRGELDFQIGKRAFIPDPPLTLADRITLVITMHNGAGIGLEWALREVGKFTDAEIQEMNITKAAETAVGPATPLTPTQILKTVMERQIDPTLSPSTERQAR